jgi:hypothetical protein
MGVDQVVKDGRSGAFAFAERRLRNAPDNERTHRTFIIDEPLAREELPSGGSDCLWTGMARGS